MSTYSGPARLILADGTRVPGTASLKMNQHGGSPGWGGTFRPDVTTDDHRAAANDLQIELPYDQSVASRSPARGASSPPRS